MTNIILVLQGKKVYITAAMIGIAAVAEALGYEVPESIWRLLEAFGLITMRAAISKIPSNNVQQK